MNAWKDIHELAGRFWKDLFSRSTGEDVKIPVWLADRLREQQAYDASAAFRKLQRHRQQKLLRRWSVAAGILLFTSLTAYWLYENQPSVPVPEIAKEQQDIFPGGKKAILTLANGAVMNLRDSVLALEDLKACLETEPLQATAKEEISWHTLSVPRGGEFFMVLPDSTQVWLNSESVLRFPARFTSEIRKVELKGEAYFDVTHQKGKPFVVGLAEGIIMVYGTQFCVSDYENSALKATLVEGSIGFESFSGKKRKIRPSQQLTYDVTTDQVEVQEVNTRVYTSWKDQLFCFENQSLLEIMQVLSRWYDLEFTFGAEELKQMKFSGTLDKYADIKPFLRLFEAGANIKFEIQQKNVIIRKAY